MKLNKITLAALMMGVASFANAADQGSGRITFNGSIIDAPCTVDPDSVDQVVNLGQVSKAVLSANSNTGESSPEQFKILLKDCSISTLKTVTTTFTGAAGGPKGEYLGITGQASGASIVLKDGDSNIVKLGSATKPQTLANGDNVLLFSAYLKGNGTVSKEGEETVIKEGKFESIATFRLAYQ